MLGGIRLSMMRPPKVSGVELLHAPLAALVAALDAFVGCPEDPRRAWGVHSPETEERQHDGAFVGQWPDRSPGGLLALNRRRDSYHDVLSDRVGGRPIARSGVDREEGVCGGRRDPGREQRPAVDRRPPPRLGALVGGRGDRDSHDVRAVGTHGLRLPLPPGDDPLHCAVGGRISRRCGPAPDTSCATWESCYFQHAEAPWSMAWVIRR